ncbi:MAG TPA: hypothetical protein VL981_08355 [Candidatus Methylacidiphilales bacterium]|nr:hypothetical protein [Candidatus Methylacidiphilales bacterium]
MATEISNGSQTVKLYQSVNRGKAMYQLAYYMGGRRVQKNFADKAEAKRVAKQILGGLTNDAEAVEALATPELESLVAARRVLAPNYALHVAVEEHAQAVGKLGQISLREAVEFFLRHNRADVPRLTLAEIAEQFAKSREQSGLSAHYVLLPCKRPSASWCARQHGVSRQRASRLQQEFARELGGNIQFRGQCFLNRANA